MSVENFNLTIKKGEFLILTSLELDSFMLENEFLEKTKKQILKVCKEFSGASVILFFLNYNRNFSLDCFQPIYSDKKSLSEAQEVHDINKAVCLSPEKLPKKVKDWSRREIEAFAHKAFRYANWSKEYGFGIQEDGMPVIRVDFAPYAKKPISEVVTGSGARKPSAKKTAAKKPAAKRAAVKRAVRTPAKKAVKIMAKKPVAKKAAKKFSVKMLAKKPAKKASKKPVAKAVMCRR